MLCRIAVLVTLFVLTGCGGDNSSPDQSSNSSPELKVINGQPEDPSAFPEFVKLAVIRSDGSTAFCSATVIGDDTVLSAAHCLLGEIRYVYVNSVKGWTKVEGYRWHPQLSIDENGLLFYDIAVLSAPGLNLPKLGILASLPITPGQLSTVFGFGRTALAPYGQLNQGQMIIDAASTQHLIATYSDKSGVCYGDSGGAVTINYIEPDGVASKMALIGVISAATDTNCAVGTTASFINLQDPLVLDFLATTVPGIAVY